MKGIKKFRVRPTILVFSLLSIVGVGSFVFLLTQYTIAQQFTPPCDTPPGCQPASGAVTATLMDVLVNGPLAAKEFGKVKDPNGTGFIGIGGGKTESSGEDAGEVRLGIGTSTPGFPLDVISQTSGHPDDDTANLRLGYRPPSSMSGQDLNVWTGVRLDRGNSNGTQSEKWFLGMASSSDNFIIRSDSNTNLVEIPPGKGAACFGGMFQDFSQRTNLDIGAGGYDAAHAECGQNMHVCSLEEMYRTIVCKPNKIKSTPANAVWVNAGLITSDPQADCVGWTATGDNDFGSYWTFDGQTNGFAEQVNCSLGLQFSCCR